MIEFPPINRPVQLLNKLLGLKTAHSPNALSQLVQPTAEMLPWWAWSGEALIRDGGETIGAAQLGFIAFSSLAVPATSNWLLLEYSIRMQSVAGAVLQIQGAYNCGPVLAGQFFALGAVADNNAHPAETLIDCTAGRYWPLLLPPNSQLGVYVPVNGGTAQTVTAAARVVQFEL